MGHDTARARASRAPPTHESHKGCERPQHVEHVKHVSGEATNSLAVVGVESSPQISQKFDLQVIHVLR